MTVRVSSIGICSRSFTILCLALSLFTTSASRAEVEKQRFADFATCELSSGAAIEPCRVGYRTYGRLNAEKSNAVLIPTWYGGVSANHAYLASAAVIDPERHFVVIVDALGNGVSSSPSNSSRQTNAAFPKITIADMVDSQHRLLTETFGIRSLKAIVGLSMGGMQALEWSVRYPGFADKTVVAIGSPRLATYDITLWKTQIRLFELFRDCQCEAALEALAGLWMLSSVPSKLSKDVARRETAEAIKKRSTGAPLTVAASWDRQRQAEAMIKHNIARDVDDNLAQAAAATATEFLFIVSADDRVVTPEPAQAFAALVEAPFIRMDANCGHGDPWCEPDAFADAVRTFVD